MDDMKHLVVGLMVVVGVGCPRLTTDEEVNAIAAELGLTPDQLTVPPPVADDGAMTQLSRFCANGTNDQAPEPPAVPTPIEALPETCDEPSRIDAVVAACGPLLEVPASLSLAVMLSACAAGNTCHVKLSAGTYSGNLSMGCVVMEGEGEATIIQGTLSFSAPSVLARVRIEAEYGAVSTTADLLINETMLMGGYEGIGVAWSQELELTVCKSRIGAGYSGINQSWQSRRVTVAGSAMATCYEGVGISWGSSGLHLSQSIVLGGYTAVSIHQSSGVAIIGNVLFGGVEAVGISNPAVGFEDEYGVQVTSVLVQRNDVRGGSLPLSDPDHNIVVR
jgi:hypothetical protein